MKKLLIATTLVLFLSPIAALAQDQPKTDTSAVAAAAASIPTYDANDAVLAGGQ